MAVLLNASACFSHFKLPQLIEIGGKWDQQRKEGAISISISNNTKLPKGTIVVNIFIQLVLFHRSITFVSR